MSNELTVVNPQTGEIVNASESMMSMERAAAAINYVVKVKEELLKEKIDYMVTNKDDAFAKPCILKAGAEKLAAFFELAVEYRVDKEQCDPLLEWVFQKDDYKWVDGKRQKVGVIPTEVRGLYFYRVSCILSHKNTGRQVCTAQGECSSTERGRETAMSNTILKMAQKRALVGAVLNATFSSGFFTQDIDDLPPDERAAMSGNKSTAGSGTDHKWQRKMNSTYGTPEQKSKCSWCGKSHVLKGDVIVSFVEQGATAKPQWGAIGCFDAWHAKMYPATTPAPAPQSQNESNNTSDSASGGSTDAF